MSKANEKATEIKNPYYFNHTPQNQGRKRCTQHAVHPLYRRADNHTTQIVQITTPRKLLARKLLEREFEAEDRRRSILTLTATGLSVYDDVVPVSYAYEDALLTCFSVAERQQFGELIDRLYLHAGSSFK